MGIIERIRESRRRRKAIRQLRAMDPYVLRDIGIEPGQIEDAVSGMLKASPEVEVKRPAPRPFRKSAPDEPAFKAAVISKVDWPYDHRRAA